MIEQHGSRMNTLESAGYASRLRRLIAADPQCMRILRQLAALEPQAYLAAGVIRNSVWAHLHGQRYALEQTEMDVIFYDAQDDGPRAAQLQQRLKHAFPGIAWDVVNQALVHRWYRLENGASIQPLRSIRHAVSLWPETATAVAVRLDAQGNLQILAPLGLADLFQLRLRWNPALVSCTVFLDRARSKGFLAKWPKLKLAPAFFYRRRKKSLPFRKAFAD